MKHLCLLCFWVLLLCTAVPSLAQSQITQLSDLAVKKIAVPKGTTADTLVAGVFPKAKILYYTNVLDCAVAVKAGMVDAAAYDEPVLRALLRTNKDLMLLPELVTHDDYGFAVRPDRIDIKLVMDACIDKFTESGVFKFMDIVWFYNGNFTGPPKTIVEEYSGVLKFGTCSQLEPFAFKIETGEVVGFDIELAYCIAQDLGLKLELYDMSFAELFPALLRGDVDMIGAGLTITPEREQKVLFSKPYYKGGTAVMVKR